MDLKLSTLLLIRILEGDYIPGEIKNELSQIKRLLQKRFDARIKDLKRVDFKAMTDERQMDRNLRG